MSASFLSLSRSFALCLLAAGRLAGQEPAGRSFTGVAVVDSAAVARQAWAHAMAALRSADTTAALREVSRAAAAWPAQPVYVWAEAVLAARMRDGVLAQAALRRYASLGLGADLAAPAFDSVRHLAWFDSLSRALAANRAPVANSHVLLRMRDSTIWPEGLDYDRQGKRFFVTSIRHRTVVVVSDAGVERELWATPSADMGAMFAVRWDPVRRVLWATTAALPQMDRSSPADSTAAALLELNAEDGSLIRRWDLPRGEHHAPGDVAIGEKGEVYVADSDAPVLYRLRTEGDTLEAIRNPLFRSLQGIGIGAHGVLYVADYSHGLLRVDPVARTATVLEGSTLPTLGCDGLLWYRNSLIAIQNGVAPARVVRFYLDGNGGRIVRAQVIDRNSDVADEPTNGIMVGDQFVYVANSQWEKFDDAGVRRPGVPLSAPLLLALPVAR